MKIGHIDFPPVVGASGARNFFPQVGWWWHKSPFHRLAGLTPKLMDGMAFTSKTTTLELRPGNMPLREDGLTPKERFPKCIRRLPGGHTLNCVGLSGPGLVFLLQKGVWQQLPKPFFLSVMAVAGTSGERQAELAEIVHRLHCRMRDSNSEWALQLNFGCPNTEHGLEERQNELWNMLEITAQLGAVPVTVNFSPVAPLEVMLIAGTHPKCDGLFINNTIEWGYPAIRWQKEFGQAESPFTPFFGKSGGLSGPLCYGHALERVAQLRDNGVTIPIVVGNGISCRADVEAAKRVGASGVALGITAPLYYPWRVVGIIATANELFA